MHIRLAHLRTMLRHGVLFLESTVPGVRRAGVRRAVYVGKD